jgi:hypothetical protein
MSRVSNTNTMGRLCNRSRDEYSDMNRFCCTAYCEWWYIRKLLDTIEIDETGLYSFVFLIIVICPPLPSLARSVYITYLNWLFFDTELGLRMESSNENLRGYTNWCGLFLTLISTWMPITLHTGLNSDICLILYLGSLFHNLLAAALQKGT